ncbi:MAG TPA: hypothetical protein VHV57_12225 [Acidimicrobiales bacterium]|nr:hypothetical protein [Acidimicrobiales bacterium]
MTQTLFHAYETPVDTLVKFFDFDHEMSDFELLFMGRVYVNGLPSSEMASTWAGLADCLVERMDPELATLCSNLAKKFLEVVEVAELEPGVIEFAYSEDATLLVHFKLAPSTS